MSLNIHLDGIIIKRGIRPLNLNVESAEWKRVERMDNADIWNLFSVLRRRSKLTGIFFIVNFDFHSIKRWNILKFAEIGMTMQSESEKNQTTHLVYLASPSGFRVSRNFTPYRTLTPTQNSKINRQVNLLIIIPSIFL